MSVTYETHNELCSFFDDDARSTKAKSWLNSRGIHDNQAYEALRVYGYLLEAYNDFVVDPEEVER